MGRNTKRTKLFFDVLSVLLIVIVLLLIITVFFFMNDGQDNRTDSDNEVTPQSTDMSQSNSEQSQEKNGVINTYTAIFEVRDTKNMTLINEALDIINQRIELFEMIGEAYLSDAVIVLNVGITSEEQQDYLKFLATPGDISLTDIDNRVIISRSMIKEHDVDMTSVDDNNNGILSLTVYDKYIDNIKKKSKELKGKEILLNIDGNVVNFFKLEHEINDGTIQLSTLETEWIKSLHVLLLSGKINVSLAAKSATSENIKLLQ